LSSNFNIAAATKFLCLNEVDLAKGNTTNYFGIQQKISKEMIQHKKLFFQSVQLNGQFQAMGSQ